MFLLPLILVLYISTGLACENDANLSVDQERGVLSIVSYPFKKMWEHKKKFALMGLGVVVFCVYKQNKILREAINQFDLIAKNVTEFSTPPAELSEVGQTIIDCDKSWFIIPQGKKAIYDLVGKNAGYFTSTFGAYVSTDMNGDKSLQFLSTTL